jgi:hypothetical protein
MDFAGDFPPARRACLAILRSISGTTLPIRRRATRACRRCRNISAVIEPHGSAADPVDSDFDRASRQRRSSFHVWRSTLF